MPFGPGDGIARAVESAINTVGKPLAKAWNSVLSFFGNVNSPTGSTGERTSRGGVAITGKNGRQGDQRQLDEGDADIDQAPVEAFDGMKGFASLKTNQNQKTGGDGKTNGTTGNIKSLKNNASAANSDVKMSQSALKDGKTIEKYVKAVKGSIESGNTDEVSTDKVTISITNVTDIIPAFGNNGRRVNTTTKDTLVNSSDAQNVLNDKAKKLEDAQN